MSDKSYIGTGRQREGSYMIEVMIDLDALLMADTFELRGKRYVKCTVAKRWKPSEKGATHNVFLPEKERQSYNDRLIDDQERQE